MPLAVEWPPGRTSPWPPAHPSWKVWHGGLSEAKTSAQTATAGYRRGAFAFSSVFSFYSVSNLFASLKTITIIKWNNILLDIYFKTMYKLTVKNQWIISNDFISNNFKLKTSFSHRTVLKMLEGVRLSQKRTVFKLSANMMCIIRWGPFKLQLS